MSRQFAKCRRERPEVVYIHISDDTLTYKRNFAEDCRNKFNFWSRELQTFIGLCNLKIMSMLFRSIFLFVHSRKSYNFLCNNIRSNNISISVIYSQLGLIGIHPNEINRAQVQKNVGVLFKNMTNEKCNVNEKSASPSFPVKFKPLILFTLVVFFLFPSCKRNTKING